MKRSPILSAVLGPLAVAMLFTGCAVQRGIEVLKEPVARSSGLAVLFDRGRFSPSTNDVLRREGLSGEDPDATIRALNDKLRGGGQLDVRLAAAEVSIGAGLRDDEKEISRAFGYLLTAVELSEPGLALPDSDLKTKLEDIFDLGSGEIAALLHRQGLADGQRLEIAGPLRTYLLKWKSGSTGIKRADYYDTLTPTSRMKVRGYETVNVRPGVGGCMVGYRDGTEERRIKEPFMPLTGYAVPLTATLDWSGGGAEVVLHDVLEEEKVTLAGKIYPLAADFTAAVATASAATPGGDVGWLGLIRPGQASAKQGLYLLEPWRPDRIPLILVHGLMSSPRTWETVINACYGDPVIRKNYQILVFFYPTGFPIAENAATLRERLKAFQELYDPQRSNTKMRETVMVGHSMGCNLTNFQIRDGGDSLWSQFFNKPISDMDLPPAEKAELQRRIYFKANPDISRVIFICGPHRGSPIANGWIGMLAIDLIRLPLTTINYASNNILSFTTGLGHSVISESHSSIANLDVNSPVLVSILKQPMPEKPVIHSIIGDRGKASGVGSSDGVVPYWSSHLDGVKSEYWIPASHTTATRNPQNAREIRRILYEHLGNKLPAASH
ncbi:MAG: hypothetical protein ABIS50_14850 [Luteolibacter sp.]|uniref:esterase/lipase family protein n=1 Tax=Luteolibacter sp. TaxID=1962973 RepID=UPI0032672443